MNGAEEEMRWFVRNPPKDHVKGLPILRVLVFGVLIVFMLSYSLIYFAGAALDTTGHLTNATLASQYNSIKLNATNPSGGIFQGMSSLNRNLSQLGNNYTHQTASSVNILSTAASFFSSLLPSFNTLLYYSGSVFASVGVPAQYFTLIGTVMFVAALIIALITIASVIYS